MFDDPAAPGIVPGAVSLAGAGAHGPSAGVCPRYGAVAWRAGDGIRWSLFIVLSIALHASFLLCGPRATREAQPSIAVSNPVEVRLIGVPALDLPRPGLRAEAEWTPLEPLALNRPSRPRMLDFAPVEPTQFDENDYLPLSRVTLRPVPITRVAVPYPSGAQGGPSTEAKVVLFIDEDGTVAKVALAKDQAPTPFALSAKTTFERVRYRPAQLEGKPVKVRVAVAVTFEDRQAKP